MFDTKWLIPLVLSWGAWFIWLNHKSNPRISWSSLKILFNPKKKFDSKQQEELMQLKGCLTLTRLMLIYLKSGGLIWESLVQASRVLPSNHPIFLLLQKAIYQHELGMSTQESLKQIRGFSKPLDRLISIIQSALETGSTTTEILHLYLIEGEKYFFHEFEVKASQIGIRLIFPLVFCILPALMLLMIFIGFSSFFSPF